MYREASDARVLAKCHEVAWPDGPVDAEYLLADAGGTIISNCLVIDQADGTDKKLEWTLEAYTQVSRTKYQSKALMDPSNSKYILGTLHAVLYSPVYTYESGLL